MDGLIWVDSDFVTKMVEVTTMHTFIYLVTTLLKLLCKGNSAQWKVGWLQPSQASA